MRVFISWSGDHSKQLGAAIHWWLRKVLQFTRPYFTPANIDKGARWANEISKELEQSKIGIIVECAPGAGQVRSRTPVQRLRAKFVAASWVIVRSSIGA